MVIIDAMKESFSKKSGVVTAIVLPFRGADNANMKNQAIKEEERAPGCNVKRLRISMGWSQRELADNCNPSLDKTTIHRLELNKGYTQDTLERVSAALHTTRENLFLPAELEDWPSLPEESRKRIGEQIKDAAIAHKYRKQA